MILETSALIAILWRESDAKVYTDAIGLSSDVRMSAANFLEAAMAADRQHDPAVGHRLDDILQEAAVIIEPVTVAQAHIARGAFRDFGRGSGHPARLNFGDCFAYALAKDKREPLLFKGNDFPHTDVEPAIRPQRP